MAYWRVMAGLTYPDAGQRDAALARVAALLAQHGRPGAGVTAKADAAVIDVDADYGGDRGQARALVGLVRAEIAGGAVGEGALHLCPQDGPPDGWWDCSGDPRAQREDA